MRVGISVAVGAALVAAAASVSAQTADDIKRDIAKCAVNGNTVSRGECYDALAKRLGVSGLEAITESSGKWSVRTEKSPIDDSKSVILMLDADEGVQVGRYKRSTPTLIIRCKEKATSVYIDYSVFLGSNDMQVTTRIDSAPAAIARWDISSDHEAVGLWSGGSAIPFIKKMAGRNQMVVRLTPYSESPVTVSFSLVGLDKVVGQVAGTCGWKL